MDQIDFLTHIVFHFDSFRIFDDRAKFLTVVFNITFE